MILFYNVWLQWLTRGHVKNSYELANLGALKSSLLMKLNFQCMGKVFCVEFQRVPLNFQTKYPTHILKDKIFIQYWRFKSYHIYELVSSLPNHLFRRMSKKTPNSASLASVREIHRWPMDFPHKEPVMRKIFPLDDVIMLNLIGCNRFVR